MATKLSCLSTATTTTTTTTATPPLLVPVRQGYSYSAFTLLQARGYHTVS